MSFTDQKPWTVTDDDLARPWCGAKRAKNFRCTLCGHKFIAGDTARWQYGADRGHINLLVCSSCDAPPALLSDRFMELYREWKSDRFWYFRAQFADE